MENYSFKRGSYSILHKEKTLYIITWKKLLKYFTDGKLIAIYEVSNKNRILLKKWTRSIY